ncbi:oxidoreductase [Agaribacterium haliotis]|uniref:oxidoreductase n=1 Tax=Agaribacterium haliotis TaxID=2013869 RepID=UPI000BB57BAB|nr:oxidoreductase [Agaribacterium haliotis]
MSFELKDISEQRGRIALITGANTGLGFELARALAGKKMTVLMACRNQHKAEAAKSRIVAALPDADIAILPVDLSSMTSVRDAAARFKARYSRLDVLINNAGLMFPPYQKTCDGFESQMAVNCFAHFLLSALLFECFPDSPDSRITWLSSKAHTKAKLNFADLNSEQAYSKMAAYGQSKLACLMYALELDRKIKKSGKKILSNAAHPGGADTDLSRHMSPMLMRCLKYTVLPFIMQSAEKGALPVLQAAFSAQAKGGAYYGPQGFMEMTGPAGPANIARQALDIHAAEKLWSVSEALTGTSFKL